VEAGGKIKGEKAGITGDSLQIFYYNNLPNMA
jgi:hypothetical protein